MKRKEEKIASVLNYIQDYAQENGYPPSLREICNACGIKSTASAHDYVEKLVDDGLLSKVDSKKRSLTPVKKCTYNAAPMIGKITAGTPILAVENLEGYYPLPEEFGQDVFMLRVEGSSMIDAGIHNGDKIIVRKQSDAQNGDIVAAMYDDCATVKRFYKRDGHVVLHPENPTMSDIILPDVTILGKVVGLMRKL